MSALQNWSGVQRGVGVFRRGIRKKAVRLVSARLYVSALFDWYSVLSATSFCQLLDGIIFFIVGAGTTMYVEIFGRLCACTSGT